MVYAEHYKRLIQRAKERTLLGYTENHHIIPKCIGGLDERGNIVTLTAREHFVAHLLLLKMYPNIAKLAHAALMMTVNNVNRPRSKNRLYEWVRKKHAVAAKQRTGDKNGSFGKPWYHNPDTLECGKFIENKQPLGWKIGRSPNTKCIICNEDTGSKKRKYCKKHKPKPLSPHEKGTIRTEETNNKLSEYCRSRTKEQHPQFGKRWINNGVEQKMILKDDLEMYTENGWKKGKL